MKYIIICLNIFAISAFFVSSAMSQSSKNGLITPKQEIVTPTTTKISKASKKSDNSNGLITAFRKSNKTKVLLRRKQGSMPSNITNKTTAFRKSNKTKVQ